MVNICKNCKYYMLNHVCINSDSPFDFKIMPEGDNCKCFEGKENANKRCNGNDAEMVQG